MAYDQETLERFQILHSEIIQYYQLIENDMRRFFAVISDSDYTETMEELGTKNWSEVLNRLRKLDNSDGRPFLEESEYDLFEEIRPRRNYWCHQCYLDFAYIRDDNERNALLKKKLLTLENEHNRTYKIHRKLQDNYVELVRRLSE